MSDIYTNLIRSRVEHAWGTHLNVAFDTSEALSFCLISFNLIWAHLYHLLCQAFLHGLLHHFCIILFDGFHKLCSGCLVITIAVTFTVHADYFQHSIADEQLYDFNGWRQYLILY